MRINFCRWQTATHIAIWLETLGMQQYITAFQQSKIDNIAVRMQTNLTLRVRMHSRVTQNRVHAVVTQLHACWKGQRRHKSMYHNKQSAVGYDTYIKSFHRCINACICLHTHIKRYIHAHIHKRTRT